MDESSSKMKSRIAPVPSRHFLRFDHWLGITKLATEQGSSLDGVHQGLDNRVQLQLMCVMAHAT